MLGHASAAMTLDVYADLFDGDLDSVSDALDNAISLSGVPKMCPSRFGELERALVPYVCTDLGPSQLAVF